MRYNSDIRVPPRCANSRGLGRHLYERVDVLDSTCSVNGCDRKVKAHGWCGAHYQRWLKDGDVGANRPLRPLNRPTMCTVDGCGRRIYAHGMCNMHYIRLRAHGSVGSAQPIREHSNHAVDGYKLCIICLRTRPVAEFYSSKRSPDRYHSWCRDCHSDNHLKRNYGLTRDQFDTMVASQGGRCAACGDIPAGRLVPDHCHDSGAVREGLCEPCNVAIGFLRDDPNRALAAAAYLQKWAHLKEVSCDRFGA